MPWVQIALQSFHLFGFLQKINTGRFNQVLSSPWAGFRPRRDRKISWYKINPAGTWGTRVICYTLHQGKRPGTEVNGTDRPHPERSIRNGIMKKTASNGCQLEDKSLRAMPLQSSSACLWLFQLKQRWHTGKDQLLCNTLPRVHVGGAQRGRLVARGRNTGDGDGLRSELTELVAMDWHEGSLH